LRRFRLACRARRQPLPGQIADSTAAQLLGAQLQNAQLAAAPGANALGASGALGK
jgi:hypothetical protein